MGFSMWHMSVISSQQNLQRIPVKLFVRLGPCKRWLLRDWLRYCAKHWICSNYSFWFCWAFSDGTCHAEECTRWTWGLWLLPLVLALSQHNHCLWPCSLNPCSAGNRFCWSQVISWGTRDSFKLSCSCLVTADFCPSWVVASHNDHLEGGCCA